MAKFIEELYYGNINPQERTTISNENLQKQMTILSDSESYLIQHLSEDHKIKFLAFSNAWSIVNGESTLDSFTQGFRLGANFVYDTFVSDSAPFGDY